MVYVPGVRSQVNSKNRRRKMVVDRVNKKMIKEWIGTDNPLKEAIEVIQELANGQYTIDSLNQDIIEYYFADKKEKK